MYKKQDLRIVSDVNIFSFYCLYKIKK